MLTPPGDIHAVVNDGASVAASLHVYGADLRQRGTSVRRCTACRSAAVHPADRQVLRLDSAARGNVGMKLGLHYLMSVSESQSPSQRYRDTVEQAVRAEGLGFESVWPVEQHFNQINPPYRVRRCCSRR